MYWLRFAELTTDVIQTERILCLYINILGKLMLSNDVYCSRVCQMLVT